MSALDIPSSLDVTLYTLIVGSQLYSISDKLIYLLSFGVLVE